MDDTVERVAMRLFAHDGLKHAATNLSLEQSWEMSPRYHDKYRGLARAALEAMREPTENMREVGGWSGGENGVGSSSAAVVWYAMIDAALPTP